ncbi:Zona pellucida sperm-binding protein 3 receptor, partial [Ophiophagus hannah]
VKCQSPSTPNGRVSGVLLATYTYQNKIIIECNPGYTLLGSSLIKCDADSRWKPSVPRCDKEKSLEDRLDIIEKKLDLILHILQLTRDR